MIKQIYLNDELTEPIGDWFSDLYITGFQLEKCNLSNRKFTFAIICPDIPSATLAISLGLIWQNIYKNTNQKDIEIKDNSIIFDEFLSSLAKGDEVFYDEDFYKKNFKIIQSGKKKLKRRIFFETKIDKNSKEFNYIQSKEDIYKFMVFDGKKTPHSIFLEYSKVKKMIASNSLSNLSTFVRNFFTNKSEQDNFNKLSNFIYILGHKAKFKELTTQSVYIQNTTQGTFHKSVKGSLGDFIKLSEDDDDINSIATLKSDLSQTKINFNEIGKRPFTIFMGANAFMKHGSQRNINNRIIILSTKDAQLQDAVDYLNNDYTTTEDFKESSEKIKSINKNFPAIFFQ